MSEEDKEYQSTSDRIKLIEKQNTELEERLQRVEQLVDERSGGIEENDKNASENDYSENYTKLTRRGTLASVVGLGLFGAGATGSASASEDSLGFGSTHNGSPGTGFGLHTRLQESGTALQGVAGLDTNQNGDIGVLGRTYSTDGVGLTGHAAAESGSTRGLYGRVDSPHGVALQGRVTTTDPGNSVGIDAVNRADEGVALKARAAGSGETTGLDARAPSSNGTAIYTPHNAEIGENLEVKQDLNVDGNIRTTGGDLEVEGTKHFVQAVETSSGPKEVVYTSVEAGRPVTETNGVEEMEDGHTIVELPDHFSMVTSEEEQLTVQITPYAGEAVQPQIVEHSTSQITVRDFGNGPNEYSFAYTVKGVRSGFEDKEVVRDS